MYNNLALILLTYNGEKEGYLEAAEKHLQFFFIILYYIN